jgi:hypothetical protein
MRALELRAGVEPACSVLRDRPITALGTATELARTGGLEPPPSGFVGRRIVRFCYVRIGAATGIRTPVHLGENRGS